VSKAPEFKYPVSDKSVTARTGRDWPTWFRLLDAIHATDLSHAEIAKWIASEHGVDGWWCQMVTVCYEQARGMRAKNQKSDGYSVSVTKTVTVPLPTLCAAFATAEARTPWLGPERITLRKVTGNKSQRMTWVPDGSDVSANFYAKGETKSQVSIDHAKLPNAQAVEHYRTLWRAALTKLKAQLEG